MKDRKYLLILVIVVILALATTQAALLLATNLAKTPKTKSVAIRSVGNDIAADGEVHSENEATLHFQTAGKLIYLPFKVGDSVASGQTIASLDTRTIEDNLKSALAAANSQQLSFDTTNDKNGDRALTDTGLSTSAFRELQTAANTLTETQLAVDIQKIAQEQAALTAPFSGVITAEDVTTPNVNVTVTTSFSLADPTALVFRTNVSANDIDFVKVGSSATVHITGYDKPLSGTVERIYPQQITVGGQNVYQVDITSNNLHDFAKLGQTGAVTIKSIAAATTVLVPTWAILGHNAIWIVENNHPILKYVTVGKAHGQETEILSGLTTKDRVITNPASIAAQTYTAL